ncbi:hypothetical protein CLAFUW4_08453 [Fulvia fulva]|uniref:Gfd2/YDR514C-like C-terminal domain-containing protein n=1 Tax=Passalora fulva TaxID=5499 RepID=A0A9Q8P6Q4_PASFU|nr:uncharacterized protein CLAFUR5_08557 [Fulvia fulva]KAK4628836.1 hypothetical protein CLAFUR4_08458 [Fulvia fulva]KAK4629985.1 hypothetical protein CLAFUR0_08453 [Fulvia fulva]UJO15077.1 hypothetical protein CLAFUR5_08557 [Fulvia fulva]WPV12257.1 hypothetical protein CLAFUW4_08453 [Fulvia fulva]WPV27830.1 hypothetical protein CLAFUW7_08453 [Fulvia fulva]
MDKQITSQTKDSWRQRWFSNATKKRARAEYHDDFGAYLAAFKPEPNVKPRTPDKEIRRQQRVLARAPHRALRESYYDTAEAMMKDLVTSLSSGRPTLSAAADIVFVCIDLEGDMQCGISELGVATLDTRDLFKSMKSASQCSIETMNYRLSKRSNRKFMHGQTTDLSADLLKSTILDSLVIQDDQNPSQNRNIILVGHSVRSELASFDGLGIPLEDLPSKSVLDTYALRQQIFGHSGALHEILEHLHVPHVKTLLHCAGNDAHHTLQALAAMLAIQLRARTAESGSGSVLAQLEGLAKKPVILPLAAEKREQEDWEDFLGEGSGLDWGEDGDVDGSWY